MPEFVDVNGPPRRGRHANSPGDYTVVARLDKAVADKGEKLTLEVYLVGYGEISSPQISYYPSSGFFDTENSFMHYDFGHNETGKGVFGVSTHQLKDPVGGLYRLYGVKFRGSEENTVFFDDPTAPGRVATATRQVRAPLEFEFLINSDARAGTHYVSLVFLYFNGEHWRTSNYKAEFTIRSSFQRSEPLLWGLGTLIAAGSFLAAIATLLNNCAC